MKEGAFSHSASEHDLKFIDALVGWSWFGYFLGCLNICAVSISL